MLRTEKIKCRAGSLTAGATQVAVALVISLCINMVPGPAAAQSRGVGIIGAGITGAIILNELSKGTGKRKFKSSRKSTKTIAKTTKSRSRKPRDDRDPEIATKRKSSEPQGREEEVATGSTGPRPEGAPSSMGAVPISTPDEIRTAQQHLKYMGYNVAEESGTLDPSTKSAVMQFQDSIGAPVTGNLTVDQLQTLFVKVAGKRGGS